MVDILNPCSIILAFSSSRNLAQSGPLAFPYSFEVKVFHFLNCIVDEFSFFFSWHPGVTVQEGQVIEEVGSAFQAKEVLNKPDVKYLTFLPLEKSANVPLFHFFPLGH